MNGEQGRCIQSFGGGNLMERDHLEDLGVDGRIILQWIVIVIVIVIAS